MEGSNPAFITVLTRLNWLHCPRLKIPIDTSQSVTEVPIKIKEFPNGSHESEVKFLLEFYACNAESKVCEARQEILRVSVQFL